MRVPKYIKKLIYRRAELASKLQDADSQLGAWIDKNEIPLLPEDYRGGVEMYSAPWASARRLIEAIEEKDG